MSNNQNREHKQLPVLPLRGLTAFPEMLIHFEVGRAMSIKALEAAMREGQMIFLTTQIDLQTEEPDEEDLFPVGTVCLIKQILRLPGDNVRVLFEGIGRAHVCEYIPATKKSGCIYAEVEPLHDVESANVNRREEALLRMAKTAFVEYADLSPHPVAHDLVVAVQTCKRVGYLADYIAQNIPLDFTLKQEILETLHVNKRLNAIIKILHEELQILTIENDIQGKLKAAIDKSQREYYLREQMKVIQTELGDVDAVQEAQAFRDKIAKMPLSDEDKDKLHKEADRLAKLGGSHAEAGVVRTYLETVTTLPWGEKTKDKLDLTRAEKILNREHYGMEKVKDRILEFIAVKSLAPDLRGQILCLAGPPGVGKTSIAKSIAETLGRKYVRVSLGGVRDEAEIRGHRRTYIGAMPGRVINAVKQAGTANPLVLLDEIDKMSNDFRGDPASAMLEVLDGEQNFAFRDHYIELPFDLTDVLFVTTANDIGNIPRPLLDRMEIIELSSYTVAEKVQIAKKHLLPKQMKKHGLSRGQLTISEGVLGEIIAGYSREAGVRRLEQLLAKICRRAAKKIAQSTPEHEVKKVAVKSDNLADFLGTIRFKPDAIAQKHEVGVVNGLAWTSVGGEMLRVEVASMPGTGKVEITGNLGTVMQESAKAAVTFVRSRATSLQIDPDFYKNTDLHIHFPEAAIPKDGPSAGVTMSTAIISVLTGAPVYRDVAMTGEVTLRGNVMPIGGLKEKTMAAYRAGIKTVLIPADNLPDLDDIDPVVREKVTFVPAEHMDTVMQTAIDFASRTLTFTPPTSPEQTQAMPTNSAMPAVLQQ